MDYSPALWMVLPFGLLLALIALGPVTFADWWGRHYVKVATTLAVTVILLYAVAIGTTGSRHRILETGGEYLSFMALVGSLYVISGGIHLNIKGEATPLANTAFLLLGALLANVLGTTGAAMLLIRPWLRMNKYRVTAHHVVFFIFIVANVGGALTPIGDPPLFLGYLRGVPFWWVAQHAWQIWAVALGLLLAMFYVVDRRNYRRAPAEVRERLAEPPDEWRFTGLSNLIFLAIVLAAVFVQKPRFLREGLMIGAAVGSWLTTRKSVYESNHFDFHPIKEVAVLFLGIFGTMMPALDWLQQNAGLFGTPTPGLYYWASGSLSSFLDNAPTYLSFLSAETGFFARPELVQAVLNQIAMLQTSPADLAALTGPNAEAVRQTISFLRSTTPDLNAGDVKDLAHVQTAVLLANPTAARVVLAISMGAVFFGANTYIGNGPNFMVKSIADRQKVHTPSFLNYIVRFTLPFMLPVLVVVWWLFFRH